MLRFDTPLISSFWQSACADLGIPCDSHHCACTFAEPRNPVRIQAIDALSELALSGQKRGTAHLEMQFREDNIPMREIGDYWIVLKCDGTPMCVVRIIAIEIVPFNQVGPEFAASEGEGDLSRRYWREAHGAYFQAQCDRWGVTWRDDLLVVCENFLTVYRPGNSAMTKRQS